MEAYTEDGRRLPAKACRVRVYERERLLGGRRYEWREARVQCLAPGGDGVAVLVLVPEKFRGRITLVVRDCKS